MKRYALFAIIWGIAGMGWTTYTNWYDSSHGLEVKFKIQGYDPRDYLAGHYLTYQVDYGRVITCGKFNNEINYQKLPHCLCLKVDNLGLATANSGVTEDCTLVRDSCSLWIKGQCNYYGNFEAQIERYYIPESNRADNITTPENAQIIVRLTKSGRGMVTGMER